MLQQLSTFLPWSKKRLRLAFEYGVIISQVARENGIDLTPELIERAERMLISEFGSRSVTRLSTEMHVNILSVFELDLTK